MDLWFPKTLERIPVPFRSEIERQVDMDQAARLVHGLYVYPLFLAILYHSTETFQAHAQAAWCSTGVMLFALVWRIIGLIYRNELYTFSPRLFRGWAVGSLVGVAVPAGLLHMAITVFYGVDCWAFATSALLIAGCTSGGVSSFIPNRLLRTVQILGHLLPGFIAAVLMYGKRGNEVAFALAALAAYSFAQGGGLQKVFWQQVLQQFQAAERSRDLEAARRDAEAADRAKSFFIANVSHELRTPMNGVMGMINEALETDSATDCRDCLLTARDSAGYLLETINEILDFSKIEAGKLVIEYSDFGLRKMLTDLMAVFCVQANRKKLNLQLTVHEDVPRMVRGDFVRVRQVLVNLLGNALKFTEAGTVRVKVKSQADDPWRVEFTLEDTGIGIPHDKQDLIFEAFSQADASTARRFGGTGLGLTICSRLVKAMGGAIRLESTPDEGSSFHFTIGFLKAQEVPVTSTVTPKSIDRERVTSGDGLRILLVEDNPVNQKLALRLLEKAGYSVTLAANGREAVDRFTEHSFHAILMDLQMPVMDGFEATALIREREQPAGTHTPIIALTAHALPEHELNCRQAGMDGYVTKPIDVRRLHDQLDCLVPRQTAA